MAKRLSSEKSKTKKTQKSRASSKNQKSQEPRSFRHRSFRRSYREDYQRETKLPSIMQHILETFRIIFKNWRLFLPLILIAVVLQVLLVGVMSEANYNKLQESIGESNEGFGKASILLLSTTRTIGFTSESAGATLVFQALIFVMVALTTIFILRFLLAKKKIKLRDALYNAMAPMVPMAILFLVVMMECIPILLLTIAYTAAVQTEFLNTPFYALLFFGFAGLMILISGYLLTSSLIAFVAVSAPGTYPLAALNLAAELMRGRRMNLILRLIALIMVIVIMWVIIMIPIIMFDLAVKGIVFVAEVPIVPILLMVMISFTNVFVTAYLYLYYRWLLDN